MDKWHGGLIFVGTDSVIFQEMKVNNTLAAGLAAWVTELSAAIILTKQDKHILVFDVEEVQSPAPSQCW